MKLLLVIGILFIGMILLIRTDVFDPQRGEAQLSESPWPMFRHDAQRTGISPSIGPQTPDLKWVFPSADQPGPGFGSPVIGTDGTIYIGSGQGLYAINPEGTMQWLYEMPGLGSANLALGPDGVIYVQTERELLALNQDGTVKWQYSLAVVYSAPHFAVAEDGTLYFTVASILSDGFAHPTLVALHPDGFLLWLYDIIDGITYERPDNSFVFGSQEFIQPSWSLNTSSPSLSADGTIYFGYEQTLFAVNSDGTEKWQKTFEVFRTYSPNVGTPSISADGTVFVTVKGFRFWQTAQDQGITTALHTIDSDSTIKWVHEFLHWPVDPITLSPDGTVYAWERFCCGCCGNIVQVLYALDPDGNLRWGQNIKPTGPPWVVDAEGSIYTATESIVRAIDFNGNEKWSWYGIDYVWPYASFSPAIGRDETLYVPTSGKLYAFGPEFTPTETPTITNTPTPTITPTNTPTPTITPTPTPTLVPGCDMSVTKTDSADPVNTGAIFSYNLAVRNYGDASCNRVTLRDRLPREVSDIIAFGIPCALRLQEITCHLFSINPGERAQLEIIVTAPTEPDTLTNRAFVTTTTHDVNRNNNSASETTIVEAPAFPAEDRDIVFIQGIDSGSSCSDDNGNGLPDGFVDRVDWMKNYLTSQEWIEERVSLEQFLYFSYGLYCFSDENIPSYTSLDTCDGIQQAAEELRTFIATRASAKITIIAHSMGGLVAAYMIATEDEDWVRSHIASVVTFDSPLQGLPPQNLRGLDLISACDLSDETRNQSLLDLSDSSDVVTTVVNSSTEITAIVPFYTMDAVELGFVVEVVPGESTTLDGVKIHKTIRGISHTAIWELRFVGRREERLVKQIVGCSIILADSWVECQLVSRP